MATVLNDIEWYRGDSYPLEITIKDKATSLPIDLTGYTFLFTVNSEQNPMDGTNQLFQIAGVVDPDQALNIGKVSFTPEIADTATANIGTYYYDIELSYAVDRPRTIKKAKFKIVQDITKSV